MEVTREFTAWDVIKEFEYCRLLAYPDSGKVWTLGWGHTKDVKQGDTCTQAMADAWLQFDVGWACAAVNHLVCPDLPQGVFNALVDFTYNVGTKALVAVAPYAVRKDYKRLCYALSLYVHDRAGNRLEGLVRRRRAEIDLMVGAVNVESNDSPFQKSSGFWKYLEENRKEVSGWPTWMRGETDLSARAV